MFAKLVGTVMSAPVRILNIPVKVGQRVMQELDPCQQYEAPKENMLDKIADTVAESCENVINGGAK